MSLYFVPSFIAVTSTTRRSTYCGATKRYSFYMFPYGTQPANYIRKSMHNRKSVALLMYPLQQYIIFYLVAASQQGAFLPLLKQGVSCAIS